MKKLGRLSINPERVIKNEELVNLRGGYLPGEDLCTMYCYKNGDLIATISSPYNCIWDSCPSETTMYTCECDY
ncbi:MAG: hypothetical protein Q8T08_19980 [Ignavibacteria bacterium]|nr:hypothetical protein [Ignavibacteria bacterium]